MNSTFSINLLRDLFYVQVSLLLVRHAVILAKQCFLDSLCHAVEIVLLRVMGTSVHVIITYIHWSCKTLGYAMCAGCINLGARNIHPWGWRLPLAIAGAAPNKLSLDGLARP